MTSMNSHQRKLFSCQYKECEEVLLNGIILQLELTHAGLVVPDLMCI